MSTRRLLMNELEEEGLLEMTTYMGKVSLNLLGLQMKALK